MKIFKRSFVLVLALVVSLCAVTGGTIAWFTDTVTSANNVIEAGNLDVELYHNNKTVTTAEKVEATTRLFTLPTYWEPGAVAYENLTVANKGNLAFNYVMTMNAADYNTVDGNDLRGALKVGVVANGVQSADRAGVIGSVTEWYTFDSFKVEGSLLANAPDMTYGVVIYWEPTADDNKWNVNNGRATSDGLPLQIDLGVKLVATQKTAESDSFDNNYDIGAVTPVKVTTEAELAAALAGGYTVNLTQDMAVSGAMTVRGNAVINLNGFDLDASANTSRPFELVDGASLVVNAEGSEVKCGLHGFVRIPINGSGAVTINGGHFTATTANGSFVYLNGTGDKDVTLNNVTYVDSGTGAILNTGNVPDENDLTIKIDGGSYKASRYLGLSEGSSVKNATLELAPNDSSNAVIEVWGNASIENCTVIANENDKAITVSTGATATVKNCTVQAAAGHAYYVYNSSGRIDITGGSYTGAVAISDASGDYWGVITQDGTVIAEHYHGSYQKP